MLTVTADGSTPSASSPSVSGPAAISLQIPAGGIVAASCAEAPLKPTLRCPFSSTT